MRKLSNKRHIGSCHDEEGNKLDKLHKFLCAKESWSTQEEDGNWTYIHQIRYTLQPINYLMTSPAWSPLDQPCSHSVDSNENTGLVLVEQQKKKSGGQVRLFKNWERLRPKADATRLLWKQSCHLKHEINLIISAEHQPVSGRPLNWQKT